MKVTVTNNRLAQSAQALQVLSQERLPVKAAFAITRNLRVLQDQLKDVEEVRQRLLKEKAILDEQDNPKVDEDGQAQFDSDEEREAFLKAVNDLYSEEVEVDIRKVTIDSFGDAEVPAAVLYALDWMVDD